MIARTLVSGLLLFFAGCAAGTLGRMTGSGELPSDVPKEMKERFEIQEHRFVSAVEAPKTIEKLTPPVLLAVGKKAKVTNSKKNLPKLADTHIDEVAANAAFLFPKRRPAVEPIWIGEKLVFDITYFGVSAGDFALTTMPFRTIDARRVYHIQGTAISSKVFSMIYRLNDMVETFFDYEGLFSHRFHIVLDETKQSRDSLELNDSKKRQTFYWNRWNHKVRGYTETKEFQPMPAFPQDSLSALYYLRSVPLPEGGVVTVPVVSEGKSWEAVVTVVRREPCSTPLGTRQCVVLNPETRYQGILKKQGDSFLWLTDDDRRIPVRLEAKVKIGMVVAKLRAFDEGSIPSDGNSAK